MRSGLKKMPKHSNLTKREFLVPPGAVSFGQSAHGWCCFFIC
jgi:hypothetical protein